MKIHVKIYLNNFQKTNIQKKINMTEIICSVILFEELLNEHLLIQNQALQVQQNLNHIVTYQHVYIS